MITIEVGAKSHKVINIPIKALDVGRLLLRARPNDDSEQFLSAQTIVEREGYQLSKSKVMLVDLTNRPYFVENLGVDTPKGYQSTHVLTLTEGIVGPVVPQFPLNITSVLDLPQVTKKVLCFRI